MSLFVTALLLAGLWRVIASHRELIRPEISDADVQAFMRTTTPSLGFYVAVILLAVFLPHVAAFGYLVIAIGIVTRARGDLQPKEIEDTARS